MLALMAMASLIEVASAGDLQFVHTAQVFDAQGSPVSGPQSITVDLLSATNTAVWSDTFTNVPVPDGRVTLTLHTDADGDTLESALFGASPAVAIRTTIADSSLSPAVEPLSLGVVPAAARAVGAQVLSDVAGDACDATGALAYDDQAQLLVVCVNNAWALVQ